MVKVRLESVTFGDFSKYVTLPNEFLAKANRDDIINFVLSKCKNFRKYGKHLDEKFILWYE